MVDQLLVDLPLFQEQVGNLPLPDAQQFVRAHGRKADKRAVGGIRPIGGNRMNVGMEVDQFTERLDAGNHAREDVVAIENRSVHLEYGLPRRAGEPPQEAAVVAEVDSQPLRDRPDDLPMGDRLADVHYWCRKGLSPDSGRPAVDPRDSVRDRPQQRGDSTWMRTVWKTVLRGDWHELALCGSLHGVTQRGGYFAA